MERIRVPHGLRDAAGRFYIDEGTFADARAPLRGLQPCAFVIHEFGPKRERLALQWFGRMDGTAIGLQEGALDVARNAEAAEVLRAIDVAAFENRGFNVQVGCETDDIVLSQVDEALLFATFCTAGLAFKSQVSQV
jgi:hypothetical protein